MAASSIIGILCEEEPKKWDNFLTQLPFSDYRIFTNRKSYQKGWKDDPFLDAIILGAKMDKFRVGRYQLHSDFLLADPNQDGWPEVKIARIPAPELLFRDSSFKLKPHLSFYTSRQPNSEWVEPFLSRGYQLDVIIERQFEILTKTGIAIHFNGHGDYQTWRTNTETGSRILLASTDIPSLENAPFIFSGVCLTASPHSTMLKKFLQAGASAYLGMTAPLFGFKGDPGLEMDMLIFNAFRSAQTTGDILHTPQKAFIDKFRLQDILAQAHSTSIMQPQNLKEMKAIITILEFVLYGSPFVCLA
ncbi:MAG: C25 family cysteine peptidase [Candidatus Hodarchaeota archaeon]